MTTRPSPLRSAPRRTTLVRLTGLAIASALTASGWAQGKPAASTRKPAAPCTTSDWPLWTDFKAHFVQTDGRVVDLTSTQLHSTSEGQSYGMFFALVANDPQTFQSIWDWSIDNLFAGDLATNLPAWQWGKSESGEWKVLDKNSASDADIWFVYALLEAARVWNKPEYRAHARTLLATIEKHEIVTLPGLGKMLLPGQYSFAQANDLWRLNPSYMPVPILRLLDAESPGAGWGEIAANTAKMLEETSPHGFSPDWLAYQGTSASTGKFVVDPIRGELGSYDAIRVYLWAGMLPDSDPLANRMRQAVPGLANATIGAAAPPEKVNTRTGEQSGGAPFGFSAALLPYLQATGQSKLLELQRQRVDTLQKLTLLPEILQSRPPPYYDYVLTLFSLGWIESRYQFQQNGTVKLSWEKSCPHVATR